MSFPTQIEALLERLKTLDESEAIENDPDYLLQRELWIRELAVCCRMDADAVRHLPDLQALQERTALLRSHVLAGKLEMTRTMEALGSQLRQLKGFCAKEAAEANLLNRLA